MKMTNEEIYDLICDMVVGGIKGKHVLSDRQMEHIDTLLRVAEARRSDEATAKSHNGYITFKLGDNPNATS